MLMNSVIALTFLTASSNNGGLNIDVQQEEEKRINMIQRYLIKTAKRLMMRLLSRKKNDNNK
ncbi:protein secretion system EssA [Staphylococcus aureus]|nr:Putative secretion system component EssA [Staphylococcus aureus]COY92610.1 Putative secretion system component EssA [Staphylococcus aureus]CPA80211.1 Putative secretion system component EssA [Staphylococcus aureus]CPE13007.1 Putative secretion system component EssA [Staphylococcus aureus]CXI23635.1 Putative secretion system component EssA [Staphylococcus aureus]